MLCFSAARLKAACTPRIPQCATLAKIQTSYNMRLGLFEWRQVVCVGRRRRRCTSGGGVSLIQPPLCPRILRHTQTHSLTQNTRRRSQCQLARSLACSSHALLPDPQVSPIEKLPTSQPLDKNAPALLSFSFCAQKSNVSSLNGYKAISKIGFFCVKLEINYSVAFDWPNVLPLRDYCSGHFTI